MNDLIVNNIVLIVKQNMIRQVISDMVPDMVRSIVREEMTILREEVTILREEVTSLRDEVQSELQLFYERISTVIECSYAHPALGPPSPPSPPLPETGKELDPAFGPSPPLLEGGYGMVQSTLSWGKAMSCEEERRKDR